jgi:leucyl-tRNA synthetase
MVEIPVQVNGKLRATITVPRGSAEEEVTAAAMGDEGVDRHVAAADVRKVIFVPDRLLNLVVG